MARVWHGISLEADDAAVLADMLVPMDDAGEELATRLGFEMEPSEFLKVMHRESSAQDDS